MIGLKDIWSGLGRIIGRATEVRAARSMLMGRLMNILAAIQELVASIRELIKEVRELKDEINTIVQAAKLLKGD